MTPSIAPDPPSAPSPSTLVGQTLRLLVALALVTILIIMLLHGINLL